MLLPGGQKGPATELDDQADGCLDAPGSLAGQRFAQFEPLAAHAEHEGRRRLGPFGLPENLEHGLRGKCVAGVGDGGRRNNAFEDMGRRCVDAGIDEQGQLPALQIERMFDLQLEIFDQLDAAGQNFIFGHFFEPTVAFRPDGVVAAAGVADGEDDDRRGHERLNAWTTWPSGSTSSTSSGILPKACVAQDRQGSKARMATSMWLSRPSVSSLPSRYCRATWRTASFIAWLLWVVETIRLA